MIFCNHYFKLFLKHNSLMRIEEAYQLLRRLSPKQRIEVYKGFDGTIITATRTDKICPYDFAVGLVIPGRREFYPTHVRLLFDLYLKRITDGENAKKLFCALENVFRGEDPEKLAKDFEGVKFRMQLDNCDVNLYYAQLLMIEQDFNYGKDGCKSSKYNPARTYLMGYIRWVASGDDEIDKIITGAVRNYPPRVKYIEPLDCE